MAELSRPIPNTRPNARRVPLPRVWPITARDIIAIVGVNALLIAGMWVRHGGLSEFASLPGTLTAVGQITALYGTFAALLQVVLMSRSPWLDQLFGMDRLAGWHRRLGFATLWLLIGHGVFTTLGFAASVGSPIVGEFLTMITTFPYVLMATVSLGLFIAVAVTSVRAARRRISYETWFAIHLYAYLAIALGFMHQLVGGTDFLSDPIARIYWVGLYAVVAGLVLAFRIGQPIATSLRHQLRIASVTEEVPGVVSLYITGRDLDRLPMRAGQFFLWRFLAGAGWWRAHPFSISAAPNGQYIRLTVKNLGDDTSLMRHLRPGTRVFAEGPYGAFTGAKQTRDQVLLIAGGIGITPVRALLEELPARTGGITVLYRATRPDDVVFRAELDVLARARQASLHYLIGSRGSSEMPVDPLSASSLAVSVPDIRDRDVYVCGPTGMTDAVREALRTLGVARSQVHFERFAY